VRFTERSPKSDEPEAAELYEQIGRLKVELEWVKKKVAENS
jgi:putative transposase